MPMPMIGWAEVVLDPPIRNALAELDRLLDGALAIITGRDIAAVDRSLDILLQGLDLEIPYLIKEKILPVEI